MKKLLPILILVSFTFATSCQESGMDRPFSYIFWIRDSMGNNLVGDSIMPNQYFADSIRYNYIINGIVRDTLKNEASVGKDYTKGYGFSSLINNNTTITALLKYNKNEKDTIKVVYGKDNIQVYKNSLLIFSKNNLSQVPPVEFNIIK
ncbi:MAG TPA: hypothetical protein PKI86_00885 [Chitinophagales bacterium]|nr:hypothetical protein [Chitinophagales bacterium]